HAAARRRTEGVADDRPARRRPPRRAQRRRARLRVADGRRRPGPAQHAPARRGDRGCLLAPLGPRPRHRPRGRPPPLGQMSRRGDAFEAHHSFAMATDHMPLEGWDHLELWVGNAKQAAYWYEHALGFDVVAYAGPETGVRDRASYVMRQGEIRFALTSALRETSEITQHVSRHGDGVKDIALAVPDATEAYRQAVQRGARGVVEPHWASDANGRVELA